MSFKSRLRQAEHYIRGGRCPECAGSEGIVVAYDEAAALDERCPRCGRALTIIRVVYDEPEGEGAE